MPARAIDEVRREFTSIPEVTRDMPFLGKSCVAAEFEPPLSQDDVWIKCMTKPLTVSFAEVQRAVTNGRGGIQDALSKSMDVGHISQADLVGSWEGLQKIDR